MEKLPEELQITTKLLNYGGKEVTIVAANIDDVEEDGKDAMVGIRTNYTGIPAELRIAAFQKQDAIIHSIIHGVPLEKAESLIRIKKSALRNDKRQLFKAA